MNRMKLLYGFLIFRVSVALTAKEPDWNHQHQAEWFDNYKECSLDQQSPIEINSAKARHLSSLRPLVLHNYKDTCAKIAKITNTGHTVDVVLSNECSKPYLTGDPLLKGAKYEAVSFHFHWGSKYAHGSEHIIDSKRFSMEGHVLHRNVKYPTIEEARKHRDGLAVLAVFYEAKKVTKNNFVGLRQVVESLKSIRRFNTTTGIKGIRLADLLGHISTSRFYSYEGSLTTPPCSQAVTWIVLPQAINIRPVQMQQFRLLSNDRGDVLVNNYRFLQPSGKRKVYFYQNSPSTTGPFDEDNNDDVYEDIWDFYNEI